MIFNEKAYYLLSCSLVLSSSEGGWNGSNIDK